ncbi:MAG: hypothetical protein GX092_08030 [Clostridia bacterium]|jgi:hypothetical protein|nr:hypothetical protein [Clostridia bacterium]
MQDKEEREILKTLENKVAELSMAMEKVKIAEYVEYLNNTWRMLYTNFIAGIARGLGMAVGFTILGALLIYLLRQIVLLNLPLIGDFIAEIVQLVNESLSK